MKLIYAWERLPLLGALALSFLAGCAAPTTSQDPFFQVPTGFSYERHPGVLFIAGGAVDPRGPLYPRFFEEAEKAAKRLGSKGTRVEIIPTASGDPAGSLRYNWENFVAVAPQAIIGGLPLSHEDKDAAVDPTVAERFANADAIWFTGGDQSRITKLFELGKRRHCEYPISPDEERRPIDIAVCCTLEDGGLIGGSSAGAAIMSPWMITGGNSEGALLQGHGEGGVRTAIGMGFLPFGVVDQHFLARGRLGRLLVATATLGERYGFGVEENSAMVVTQGDEPMIEVLGASGLCVLDLGPDFYHMIKDHGIDVDASQFPNHWIFEISLLGTGDRWDPVAGQAIPHASRIPLPLPIASPVPNPEPLEPWDSGAIETAIHRLGQDPKTPQTLRSSQFELTMHCDSNTQFLINPSSFGDVLAAKVQIQVSRIGQL